MQIARTLKRLSVAGATAVVLAACGTPTSAPPANPAPADQSDDFFTDDEDTPDCDREDRAAKEQPDCGRYVNGQWVWWTWAARGQTTPPAGWTRYSEPRPTTSARQQPAPKASTAKGTNTSRATPPKRYSGGGTTTRRGK